MSSDEPSAQDLRKRLCTQSLESHTSHTAETLSMVVMLHFAWLFSALTSSDSVAGACDSVPVLRVSFCALFCLVVSSGLVSWERRGGGGGILASVPTQSTDIYGVVASLHLFAQHAAKGSKALCRFWSKTCCHKRSGLS